jgi:hypothetical protein
MQNDILSALAALSDADLIARVKSLSVREREATAQLVAHLAELDTRDAYLREGYPSLFIYCRDALGLSEGEAYNRIEVARAARRFPVILELLAAGEIYLWGVRLLAPHLTAENHRDVLCSARGKKSKFAIQEIVARLAPQPDAATAIWKMASLMPEPAAGSPAPPVAGETPLNGSLTGHSPLPTNGTAPAELPVPPAVVTPLSPDRYKLQLTISGDMLEKLRLAKDMLSHVVAPGDDEAVLDRALSALLVELAKKKFADTPRPRRSPGPKDDTDIAAAVKRIVYVRDRGRCTFVGEHGHRCEERRFIQFHHIDLKCLGGPATPDNLTLRCRRHNDYEGRLWFGKRRRKDGAGALIDGSRVVNEDGGTHGAVVAATSNLFRNKLVSANRGTRGKPRLDAAMGPPNRVMDTPQSHPQ